MVDTGGHQMAHIEYPGLPTDYIMEMVHRFYDEYYFRPKAVFRIVKKAVFNNMERKRLYKEAKAFMKLRAARKKYVADRRHDAALPPSAGNNGPRQGETIHTTTSHPKLPILNSKVPQAVAESVTGDAVDENLGPARQ